MNNNTRWADGAGLFAALKRHALLGVFALAAAMSAYGQAGVTVQQGSLAGVVRDHHREFRGIPFAAPPVGKLRFRAPQPPAAWQGTRDATKFGSACPQVAMGPSPTSSANEDCLYLNVYAPTGGTNLPVMVWIHGGALTMGTGSTYDATTLAVKGNVVVVTINYRLGVLGFLASPGLAAENPHGAAGNYGLLDQQAALRWVKANIRQFGGNPDNVTIFGESAGGVSVCMHLVAPGSKDLFHKAINQSGPCAKLVRSKEANYETAKRIASNANCANEDAAVETACLRELPVEKILDAQSKTRG